jgi:hypothetical protein
VRFGDGHAGMARLSHRRACRLRAPTSGSLRASVGSTEAQSNRSSHGWRNDAQVPTSGALGLDRSLTANRDKEPHVARYLIAVGELARYRRLYRIPQRASASGMVEKDRSHIRNRKSSRERSESRADSVRQGCRLR